MAYVVRFIRRRTHGLLRGRREEAWQDWQTYDRPMVEVENIVTGHRDTIDLEDIID